MKKYMVHFETPNGNLVKGTFLSSHRSGSKANLQDAADALSKKFNEFGIVKVLRAVPYEPDGINLR